MEETKTKYILVALVIIVIVVIASLGFYMQYCSKPPIDVPNYIYPGQEEGGDTYWQFHLHMDKSPLIEDCAFKLLLDGEVVEGYDYFTIEIMKSYNLSNYEVSSNIVLFQLSDDGILNIPDLLYIKKPETSGNYRVEIYVHGIYVGGENILYPTATP